MKLEADFTSLTMLDDLLSNLNELKKSREDYKAELIAAVSSGDLPAVDAALLWHKRRIRIASGLRRFSREVDRSISREVNDLLSFVEA